MTIFFKKVTHSLLTHRPKDYSLANGAVILMSAALTGYCLFALFPSIRAGNLNLSIWSGGIVVTCFTFAWLVFKFIILRSAHPDLTSGIKISMVFLMFPLAMLAAGSLSTGGTFFSLYEPIGFFVLLLPLRFSTHLRSEKSGGVLNISQEAGSWIFWKTPESAAMPTTAQYATRSGKASLCENSRGRRRTKKPIGS